MPSVQTPQTEQADDWMLMEPECWDPKGPIIEALRLLALIETGDTVVDKGESLYQRAVPQFATMSWQRDDSALT